MAITGANRHDSMLVEPILDGLAPVKGRGRGRPRRAPVKLHADEAVRLQKSPPLPAPARCSARIARIGADSSERLGRHRWVVERTVAGLPAFRRLAVRYDRSAVTITAVATLAVTIICARRLPRKDH